MNGSICYYAKNVNVLDMNINARQVTKNKTAMSPETAIKLG